MTHDLLCTQQNDPGPKCHQCHIIDAARIDERMRCIQVLEDLYIEGGQPSGRATLWNTTLRTAVSHLRRAA